MTEISTYEARYEWRTEGTSDVYYPDKSSFEPEIRTNMERIALEKFSAELAKTNHWYKINSVTTEILDLAQRIDPLKRTRVYTLKGKTVVSFDTDIADMNAEASPSLAAAITLAIIAIAAAIMAHPTLFLLIILVIAFAISAAYLINTITGALKDLGKEPGSFILGLVVIGGTLFLGYLFFTGGGLDLFKRKKRRR
jgi:hypothetical protein